MSMLKRIGYYLIGVSLGSLLVLFVWKGKDVKFPYGPNARTLRSIQKKQLEYSASAEMIMSKAAIDTTYIQALLVSGEVDFGKSKPRLEPCAEYFISGSHNEKNIDMYVKRCDSIATIQTVWIKD
jgi:hypothetical protein